MIGYKLFKKRKDGSYGPLFINRRLRMVRGEWYQAEEHPTKGYAFRPGWHICSQPIAPHLSKRDRVWCRVRFIIGGRVLRPLSQGGIWYLGTDMCILGEVS